MVFDHLSDFNHVPIDNSIAKKYTFVEYIWVDGSGLTIRGKTKVVEGNVESVNDLPWWTYDGSSTG